MLRSKEGKYIMSYFRFHSDVVKLLDVTQRRSVLPEVSSGCSASNFRVNHSTTNSSHAEG